MYETLRILLVLNNIITFICIFYQLRYDIANIQRVYAIDVNYAYAALAAGSLWVTWITFKLNQEKKINGKDLLDNAKTLFYIWLLLIFANPLLNSLTRKVPSGHMRYIVGMLIFIHVCTFDYVGVRNNVFSLNSMYLAAILLSSKIKDELKSFLFLIISAFLFVYVPKIIKSDSEDTIKRKNWERSFQKYSKFKISVWVIYFFFNVYMLSWMSPVFVFLYWLLWLFICIIWPIIFIFLYQYKNHVQGQWDIATVSQASIQ